METVITNEVFDYSSNNCQSNTWNYSSITWSKNLISIGNTSHTLNKDKWEKFPQLLDAIIKSEHPKHFSHNKIVHKKIIECQESLKNINLDAINEILLLSTNGQFIPYLIQTNNRLKEEITTEVGKIEKIIKQITDTLSNINESDRIIKCFPIKKGSYSKLFIAGLVITIVGILVSITLFFLPIAFPAVSSGGLLLEILKGLGMVASCTGGILSVYSSIKKYQSKKAKSEMNEFKDALSDLRDHLNILKKIATKNLEAKTSKLSDDSIQDNVKLTGEKSQKNPLELPRVIQQQQDILSVLPQMMQQQQDILSVLPQMMQQQQDILSVLPQMMQQQQDILSVLPQMMQQQQDILSVLPQIIQQQQSSLSKLYNNDYKDIAASSLSGMTNNPSLALF